YKYEWTKDGAKVDNSNAAELEASAGAYSVTILNGYCDPTKTHTVAEGSGEVNGSLTINGEKVIGSGKDRSFGSCGEELTIIADYAHDAGTDFAWAVDGVAQTATGTSLTISPNADAMVTIAFTNECAAYDTIYISMKDSVKLTTASVNSACETTTLSVNSDNATGVTYTWTDAAGKTQTGKTIEVALADFPSGAGSVSVQGVADGFCDSRIETVDFTIDTLGVELSGPATVCNGGSADLVANAATSSSEAIAYSYASRPAGSSSAFTPISGSGDKLTTAALTEDTEFEVTASAGQCTKKAVFTVKIGVPSRDGALTVDGAASGIKLVGGVKAFETCGDVAPTLAVSHTGTDFVWMKDGEEIGSGASITAPVSNTEAHTERYIVNYTNECAVSDTIDIIVSPLSAIADWTAFSGEYCEGESATATLIVNGYDASKAGHYIKWMVDGSEDVSLAGMTTLSFSGLKAANSGEYSFEVSNGVCTVSADSKGTLLVKEKVNISADLAEIIVARGEEVSVGASTDKANVNIDWFDDATGSRVAAGSGAPLVLPAVDRDFQLTAVASSSDYCSDSVKVSILVDAKAVVSLSADSLYACAFGKNTLHADTTGTGTVRYPGKYKLSFLAKAEGEDWKEIGNDATDWTVSVRTTTDFKAVVTYGNQQVESDVVTITVFPSASATLSYKDKICTGSETEIVISDLKPADTEIIWDNNETLSGSGTSVVVSPTETTEYGFFYSQNEGLCRERASVIVSVEKPAEVMVEDTTICKGDATTIKMTVMGKATKVTWSIGDSVVSEIQNMRVAPSETTVYTATVYNEVCDSVTANLTVSVAELPEITEVKQTGTKQVQLSATGGAEPYEFAVKGSDFSRDDRIDLSTYGLHTYYVRDLNGCVNSIDDTLKAPELKVPAVITPNGDGVNDLFEVPGLADAYPDAKVKIYDRWGKKIAEYEAADGAWDGTYNGKVMPSTDYWYEIYVYELYKTFTGHFTLVRDKE
ncbi:MAG: T9SS type B sorting domain-containing protein, partial [Bacteroidales bacterium]|nr:T9SS type B sorting domain-containing protein [Candidatus Physcocola equi]